MSADSAQSSLRTRIKICGITRVEDGLAAVAAGADALGFVFYPPSPRAVSVEVAREIMCALPPFVSKVGLFLDEEEASLRETITSLPLDLLQFHGTESEAYCQSFQRPYIKALSATGKLSAAEQIAAYPGASAVLFDSHEAGAAGGTGETFDWSLLAAEQQSPVVLAGGLHPGNVAQAVLATRPYAVDVSSGVESAPGIKDENLMKQFVAQVQRADSE